MAAGGAVDRHRRPPDRLVAGRPRPARDRGPGLGPGRRGGSRSARRWPCCSLTALLIGTNWLLYVYAINSGHILAGSLGYYLNPLANILLGRFILKERLTRLQWAAVAIAAGGIAVLAAGALGTLWISLTLCFSFATYGLLRKIIHVESLAGLTIETALLFPIALGWLLLGGRRGPADVRTPSGPRPRCWLRRASSRPCPCSASPPPRAGCAYSTVGMLQFIAPTLQFLLAVAVYDEPFTQRPRHRLRLHLDRAGALSRRRWSATDARASSANAASWPNPEPVVERQLISWPTSTEEGHAMLNLVSLIIGIVALVCAAVAFIPLLGWANWLIIPLAVIGAGIGAVSSSNDRPQPQPVRHRRRHRPPDARRRDHVSRDPRIDAYIAKARAVRPADPRTMSANAFMPSLPRSRKR